MENKNLKIVKIKDDTEIRIERKIFRGRERIDIREFVDSENYSGPTKKGVSISIEKFEELAKALIEVAPEFFDNVEYSSIDDEEMYDDEDYYEEDDYEV